MRWEGESFDDIYPSIIKDIIENGGKCSPRGMDILELLGVSLKLRDPLKGTCLNKARKMNYAFHVIEKYDYMSGESNVDRLCFYNENYRTYTVNGIDEGAYGPRLARQYDYVYELLKKDPDTRQAILNPNNESDKGKANTPCTVSLQLLLRNGELNMIATLRSNDVLWGTGLDCAGFTSIQEMFCSWLGVDVGWYLHQAASLHAYVSTMDKLTPILGKFEASRYKRPVFDLTYQETFPAFKAFWEKEGRLRAGEDVKEEGLAHCLKSDFLVVKAFVQKKLAKRALEQPNRTIAGDTR